MDLENKIVLLTGGATGLGFAFGKKLLQSGVKHVAILDLATSVGEESAKKLNEEFGEGRVFFVACDVTKGPEFEAGFAKTVEKFGGIDIVINNAGILDERKWELMIGINFTAVVRGTLLGLQYMGKDRGGKGGVIVNIASIFGLDPFAFFPVYDGTKHAVVGFTRSFAMPYHYNKTGIRVLTMCPGVTDTKLVSGAGDTVMEFIDQQVAVDSFKSLPAQGVETVAEAMVQIIRTAKNGTVWISEDSKPVCEVLIPDRFSMKAPAARDQ